MSPPKPPKEHDDYDDDNETNKVVENRGRKRSAPPTAEVEDQNDVIQVPTTATSTAGSSSHRVVYVAVDGLVSQILEIEVRDGDSVSSIKDKIKEKAKNTFASLDAYELILFESKETTELDTTKSPYNSNVEIPLDPLGKALSALDKWYPGVKWGTDTQPLIVKTPAMGHSGKCLFVAL